MNNFFEQYRSVEPYLKKKTKLNFDTEQLQSIEDRKKLVSWSYQMWPYMKQQTLTSFLCASRLQFFSKTDALVRMSSLVVWHDLLWEVFVKPISRKIVNVCFRVEGHKY